MNKRDLIQALEQSSAEDWAPVLVSVEDPAAPIFCDDPRIDLEITDITTIHTNKRQEVIITLEPK